MDDLRGRAIELVRWHAKQEQQERSVRRLCVAVVAVAFLAGFVTGVVMPFKLQAVPVVRVHGH